MFKSARIKLTFWYLLIIMSISFVFSGFIYQLTTHEIENRITGIQRRMMFPPRPPEFFYDEILAAKHRVFWILVYTNGVIFIFSGVAGFVLAGKTFLPIEKAMEDQKRFISDASHELKTPLASMQTSIEVTLRDKNLKIKDAKKILKETLNDIENLKYLTNTLLGLSKYQQNHEIVFEKINSVKISKEVFEKFKNIADKKKVKLTKNISNFDFLGSIDEIKKLIFILLDNAIKYTPKNGAVNLSVYKKKKFVYVKITDNGIGISKKDLPHIFERFYRADSARTSNQNQDGGYGLGLSLAQDIIKAHKGKISVTSELNQGSTFLVKFPL